MFQPLVGLKRDNEDASGPPQALAVAYFFADFSSRSPEKSLAKIATPCPYEYGNKVSIAATAKSNIIVGVVRHPKNLHDSKTLSDLLAHCENSCGKGLTAGVCDRGRGPKKIGETQIILPAPPLKRDNRYQQNKKRRRCQRRAAIEPIIGHLKSDFRLSRNFLKGVKGDHINLLMAAVAWNFSLWMRLFFVPILGINLKVFETGCFI